MLSFSLMKYNYLVQSLVLAGRGLMESHWQRKSNMTKLKEFLKSWMFSKKMKVFMNALQETFEEETLQEVNYLSMVSRLINFFIYFFQSLIEFRYILYIKSISPLLEIWNVVQVKLIKKWLEVCGDLHWITSSANKDILH